MIEKKERIETKGAGASRQNLKNNQTHFEKGENMGRITFRTMLIVSLSLVFVSLASAQVCVECHKKITPNIVSDWQLSKHHQNKIGCSECHGDHTNQPRMLRRLKSPHRIPVPPVMKSA